MNFDNQLAAVEAALKARQHDYEELLMMSHDARHAKQVAEVCACHPPLCGVRLPLFAIGPSPMSLRVVVCVCARAQSDLHDLEAEVKELRETRERELMEHEMLLKQQTEREERVRDASQRGRENHWVAGWWDRTTPATSTGAGEEVPDRMMGAWFVTDDGGWLV